MSNEKDPFVSIIFPNWNGKEDSLEYLNSLRRLEYPKDRLEIIISDNGSIDGSQNAIKQIFSKMKNEGWNKLKLIENKKNIGPSMARNKGIIAANEQYKYLWMTDNDIIVDIKSLRELLNVAENYEEIGVVGSVNYYFDNPYKIWNCGTIINWRIFTFKNVDNHKIRESNILYVDEVPGCSFIIKKETINAIGIYDPDYFCYYNETDLFARAKKAGFKVCISTASKVWHKISTTTKKISGFKTYFKTRNLILLIKKNSKLFLYLLFLVILFVWYLPRDILKYIIQKDNSQLVYLFKGLKDGLFSHQQSLIK